MMIAPACEGPDSAAVILALFAEARRRRIVGASPA